MSDIYSINTHIHVFNMQYFYSYKSYDKVETIMIDMSDKMAERLQYELKLDIFASHFKWLIGRKYDNFGNAFKFPCNRMAENIILTIKVIPKNMYN